jgi:hypothetical protein
MTPKLNQSDDTDLCRLALRIGILIWAVVLTVYSFWVYAAV